jgi:deoxycytidylate deaminase
MNPAIILNNNYYLKCINLALKSKGNERYGSIVVADGRIIGEGYNRAIAHPSFGRLERKIRQGMANHAEVEAINNAILKDFSIKGTVLYVAGYFPKSGQLFFKNDYTCVKCIPHIRNYGINSIYVPTPSGWIKKSLDMASEEAKRFTKGTHQKRLDAIIGYFFISQLNF